MGLSNIEELKPVNILMADDDDGDRRLAMKALQKHRLINHVYEVEDGAELLDYLNRKGEFSDSTRFPFPDLVLLDLNMPKKSGLEALKEIRESQKFKELPIVILTTSESEEDIYKGYDLGVNSYITKPVTFQGLSDALTQMSDYWFAVVKLPKIENGVGAV